MKEVFQKPAKHFLNRKDFIKYLKVAKRVTEKFSSQEKNPFLLYVVGNRC